MTISKKTATFDHGTYSGYLLDLLPPTQDSRSLKMSEIRAVTGIRVDPNNISQAWVPSGILALQVKIPIE